MAMNCDSVLKFFIFVLNTILFALGLAVAGIAGYIAFNKKSMFHEIIAGLNIPGGMIGLYILLAVGLAIAIVSILGCVGALGENRLLLWLNFFFVLLVFIMQLVAVIMCFYKYKVVKNEVIGAIKDGAILAKNGNKNVSTINLVRNVMGFIEQQRKCCGLYGPHDYGSYIPDTCRNHSYKPRSSKSTSVKLRDTDYEFFPQLDEVAPVLDESTASGTNEAPPTASNIVQHVPLSGTSLHATSPAATTNSQQNVLAATKASTVSPSLLPAYSVGCIAFLKPIVYGAGGVAIGILVLELLLLIFTGWLLCEIGKDYEYIP